MRHSLNPRQNGTVTYTDKEGIRQQQLLAFIPRHHKHYILPNSVSKKVHFSPQLQTDPRENYLHAKSCLQPSGLLRTSKMLMVRQLALLNRRKMLRIDGLCKKMGYKDTKLLMLYGY
ncbi:hypothetical protein ES288_D08G121900v1 [Gossypium darwinii]|uniref:Uncharacterized protein n=1 Tax=Gossypium darwinii TaxID=34276 RepID=A0A5D2BNC2_GOSDA|nr:hypothetical protein ES288_D08G121900v1 [Gossypium darwinii]